MTEVARQRAIGVLEREWHDMDTWLRSLSESDLDRPVFGEGPGWCVRDMIPHMAWWQGLAGRVAEKIAAEGGAPDQRGSRARSFSRIVVASGCSPRAFLQRARAKRQTAWSGSFLRAACR